MKKLTLISFLFISSLSFAQDNQPLCFHQVKTTNPSEIVLYLKNKFGEDQAEQKLMMVRTYEMQNNVRILCQKEFQNKMESIDVLINQTQDAERIALLESKRAKFILITIIENQIF